MQQDREQPAGLVVPALGLAGALWDQVSRPAAGCREVPAAGKRRPPDGRRQPAQARNVSEQLKTGVEGAETELGPIEVSGRGGKLAIKLRNLGQAVI